MYVYRPHCDIDVKSDGVLLNAFRLIELTRSLDIFSLQFVNRLNESGSITFIQNRDAVPSLELTGQRPGVCHFSSISNGDYSSLSTCSLSQLGGIISIGGKRFVLEAEANGSLYFIPFSSNDCGFSIKQKRDTTHVQASYYAKYLDGKWRYVEFAFIADHSLYEKYGKNATAVHERLQTIANHMNALYQPINIRVSLVWADIWSGVDPITVQANSDITLRDFLAFRKTFNNIHHNDNAHLLTNIQFDNNVVGKAYKGTMCSFDHSGGVNMDHNPHAAFVAATVAHEMGHNFGMDHDTNSNDCKCETPSGCIMMPSASSYTPPTFWSECSLKLLHKGLSHGLGDACLFDQPKELFGGARCGNSIVEDNEECDCGSTVSCNNNCCDPKTCKLVKGAQCATGGCCDLSTCKIKDATTKCRNQSNSCDLPEYCDGQVEHCPADFYVQDGLPCPDNPSDFCYDGQCGNRDAQCKMIWGSTGRNANPLCYQLNTGGNTAGNCGYNHNTNLFIPCKTEDKLCGRLQCDHENEKHEMSVTYSLQQAYSTIRTWDQRDAICRVVFTKYRKAKDPGLVLNGAACGDDMMCVNWECKNRTEEVKLAPKCKPESCNNAGICNNMGNCHCQPGYGGVDCAIPGYGGSVNSGPASERGAFDVGFFVFWLILVLVLIFCIASYFVKRRRNVWLHKEIWKKIKITFNIRRMLVPVRKAPPPPPAPIRTAELNAVWGDSPSQSVHKNSYFSAATHHIVPSSFQFHSLHPDSKNNTCFIPRMSELQNSEKSFDAMNTNTYSSGDNPFLSQSVPSSRPQRQESIASRLRPTLPPPIPPSAKAPPVPPHKHIGVGVTVEKPVASNVRAKPTLPKKPVVASKSKVKDIAARFDPKAAKL